MPRRRRPRFHRLGIHETRITSGRVTVETKTEPDTVASPRKKEAACLTSNDTITQLVEHDPPGLGLERRDRCLHFPSTGIGAGGIYAHVFLLSRSILRPLASKIIKFGQQSVSIRYESRVGIETPLEVSFRGTRSQTQIRRKQCRSGQDYPRVNRIEQCYGNNPMKNPSSILQRFAT